MKGAGAKRSGYMLDTETCAAILRRAESSETRVIERLKKVAVGRRLHFGDDAVGADVWR